MVVDPVAMAFDGDGRLFVVEMRDFPDGRDSGPHLGRVRLLEDTNGDGVFDRSHVYAENLPWPSAVICYDGGIFVAATPDIWFLKDTNGDGVADVRRVALSGFGSGTQLNPWSLVTGLAWGLDNRIHGVTAGIGGTVSAPGAPGAPAELRGRDFSFDPRTLAVTPQSGIAQSGLSFDQRGRKYVSDYIRPLRLVMYEPRYPARNPFFPKLPAMHDAARPVTPVFRLMPMNREALEDPSGILTNMPMASGATAMVPARMTMARGSLIYRGHSFPWSYAENAFIPDPSVNVIHREVLRENGVAMFAERAPDERTTEFVMSRDPWFRPMQVISGPDGALYVADMHRESVDAAAPSRRGSDRGRIYRIVPDKFVAPKPPQFSKATTFDVVSALAHTNGWHRDTASRILYERRDAGAATLLTNMLNRARIAHARLHALAALDGLGALAEPHVLRGLRDDDERVRERAILLSEKLFKSGAASEVLWNQLESMAGDLSIRVRYQLAFTAGEVNRPGKVPLLAEIVRRDFASVWTREAALSSLADGAGEFFVALAGNPQFRAGVDEQEFLRGVATMIGIRSRVDDVEQVINFVDQTALEPRVAYLFLSALGEGMSRSGRALAIADPELRLRRFYDDALSAALDNSLAAPVRIEALRLVGVSPFAYTDMAELLVVLLERGEVDDVRLAAIRALGRFNDPRIPAGFVQRWAALPADHRYEAIMVLLGRSEQTAVILSALETGAVSPADLSSVQVDFLRTHREPAIRERALQLFGPPIVERAAALQRVTPALKLTGTPGRGREIFLQRCASCHRLGGEGEPIGPDLASVKAYGKDWILSAIVEPNREVRPDYTTVVGGTRTGETFFGVLMDETPQSIFVRRPEGNQEVWPRASLQYVQPQPWSIMPEGLELGLTTQAVADLLEYIMTTPR